MGSSSSRKTPKLLLLLLLLLSSTPSVRCLVPSPELRRLLSAALVARKSCAVADFPDTDHEERSSVVVCDENTLKEKEENCFMYSMLLGQWWWSLAFIDRTTTVRNVYNVDPSMVVVNE